jgi:hypothetical protein
MTLKASPLSNRGYPVVFSCELLFPIKTNGLWSNGQWSTVNGQWNNALFRRVRGGPSPHMDNVVYCCSKLFPN